jgi:hypothetical protein
MYTLLVSVNDDGNLAVADQEEVLAKLPDCL